MERKKFRDASQPRAGLQDGSGDVQLSTARCRQPSSRTRGHRSEHHAPSRPARRAQTPERSAAVLELAGQCYLASSVRLLCPSGEEVRYTVGNRAGDASRAGVRVRPCRSAMRTPSEHPQRECMVEKSAQQLSEHQIGDQEAAFVMVEWSDRGESSVDSPIAPFHIHHGGEEAWYVLEGVLGVRLGDENFRVGAGAAVVAQRGTAHAFWNAGSGRCRYVVVMTPEIHDLICALHAPGQGRDRASLEALFSAHQSQLL
jgi:mannose-6-phosphate isomerase-like protein (cupin superfamily)